MTTTNNYDGQIAGVELTYGELTMIKLEELLGNFYGPQRDAMPVTAEFWEWRKENRNRAVILNKAGIVLTKTENQYGHIVWTVDLTKVSADSLDEARDERVKWNRTEKELQERARVYMRQCEAVRRARFGQ